MAKETLIVILIIWISSYVILPLILQSLNRLYGKSIDKCISLSIRGLGIFLNRMFQLFLIVYFLPLVLPIGFVRLLRCFKSERINKILSRLQHFWFQRTFVQISQVILSKNFSPIRFFLLFIKETNHQQ